MAKTTKAQYDNHHRTIDLDSTSFRAAFPEIWQEIYDSGVAAGRAHERKEAAAKKAEAEALKAKEPKPPTPEDLRIQEEKLPLDERAKRAWLRDASLRAEFRMGGFAAYLALLRQQEAHDRAKGRAAK